MAVATRNRKNSRKVNKTTTKTATPKATPQAKLYQGAPIPTTRLFERTMPQFKNCQATVYMAINDDAGTVTYINSYNGSPRASFDPADYTYPIKEKVVAKKIEEMAELDVTDWPSFVTNAAGRKHSRKTK